MLNKYAEAYFRYISKKISERNDDLSGSSVQLCLVASGFSKISGTWLKMYTGIEKNEKGVQRTIVVTSGMESSGNSRFRIVSINEETFKAATYAAPVELLAAAEFIHSHTDAWIAGFTAIWFGTLSEKEQENVLSDTVCYNFINEQFLEIVNSELAKDTPKEYLMLKSKSTIVGNNLCPICNEMHGEDCVVTLPEKIKLPSGQYRIESRFYKCPVSGDTYQTGEMVDESLATIRKEVVKKTTAKMKDISLLYTAINLSSRENRDICVNAFKDGTGADISDIHRYKAENPENINFENLIPHWFHGYSTPLLFVVDTFDCLRENKEWFTGRVNKDDLVIDKQCVVKKAKNLFRKKK